MFDVQRFLLVARQRVEEAFGAEEDFLARGFRDAVAGDVEEA